MCHAWIVRPYPHGKYRIKEFLANNMIAIGWPGIGDLGCCIGLDDIKSKLLAKYKYHSSRSLESSIRSISLFIFDLGEQDYVVVPDGSIAYFGRVTSKYKYDSSRDSENEGYPHQRDVEWLYDKRAISINLLTARVYDSMKGRQMVIPTYHADIEEILRSRKHYFTTQSNFEYKEVYLKRLQDGLLKKVWSDVFASALCALYQTFFPGIHRLDYTCCRTGNTDLFAELPGNLNIRIRIKHFYPDQGELQDDVVDQLADSMDPGDHGIIVTSGAISKSAIEKADKLDGKAVSFIDGSEFVDHLFERMDQLSKETLATFGITQVIGFL